MLPTEFQFIWPSGLRGEDFFQKFTNQKQELSVAAMFVNGWGRNEQSLQRTCHRCFLPSFGSFGQAISEQKIKKNRPIRNKNCLWRPCLLMDRDKMGIFIEDLPQMLPTKFHSIWLRGQVQRRRLKCEKLMDDRRRTSSDGKSSHCFWQGELKRTKKYHFNINCYCAGIVFLVQNIYMCTHFKTSFLHI